MDWRLVFSLKQWKADMKLTKTRGLFYTQIYESPHDCIVLSPLESAFIPRKQTLLSRLLHLGAYTHDWYVERWPFLEDLSVFVKRPHANFEVGQEVTITYDLVISNS